MSWALGFNAFQSLALGLWGRRVGAKGLASSTLGVSGGL